MRTTDLNNRVDKCIYNLNKNQCCNKFSRHHANVASTVHKTFLNFQVFFVFKT